MTDLITINPDEYVWENKYRPTTMDECVLPERIRTHFENMKKDTEISNLLLCSKSPGTGKTTVALALLADLDYEVLFINASTKAGRSIKMVEERLPAFCSGNSLLGKKKAVILDEADQLTPDAQKALRGVIEHYSTNVRFILTCNYVQKLSEPMRSRFQEYEFLYNDSEKMECVKQMIVRAVGICKKENVKITNINVIKELVLRNYPDNRSVIVALHNYSRGGVIDEGILSEITANDDITNILEVLKNKNFSGIRAAVPNYAGDPVLFLTTLYNHAYHALDKESIPDFIEIVGEANNNVYSCGDPEILLTHTLMLIMLNCSFK